MATTLGKLRSTLEATGCRMRLARHAAWVPIIASVSLGYVQLSFAQVTAEFHRTLTVAPAETVTLDVEVPNGELQISYGRDEQISIAGFARAAADTKLDGNFFPSVLAIDQEGVHLSIRHVPHPAFPEKGISVLYRIDVPYRTTLTSKLNRGKQNISGILGPVKAMTDEGDITAAYISKGLQAQVGTGNLHFQVIGDHVEANAGTGNISGMRLPQGVSAETGDGDITLMVVGPSTATVKKGNGRIDVRGVRGRLSASSDGGEVHVKAIPHDDWQLGSVSGNIRVELPPAAKFEVDATTNSGEVLINREDIEKPDATVHHFRQKVNGGGKRIEVRTGSGRIVVTSSSGSVGIKYRSVTQHEVFHGKQSSDCSLYGTNPFLQFHSRALATGVGPHHRRHGLRPACVSGVLPL